MRFSRKYESCAQNLTAYKTKHSVNFRSWEGGQGACTALWHRRGYGLCPGISGWKQRGSQPQFQQYLPPTFQCLQRRQEHCIPQKNGMVKTSFIFKPACPIHPEFWLAFHTSKSINRPYFLNPSSSQARRPSPLRLLPHLSTI